MNGLLWMRPSELRTSASRSENDSGDHAGFIPVSRRSSSRSSSSVKVSIPHSVCLMTMISRVSSLRCEIASERITSSVTTPPALRMMCASPFSRPRMAKISIRESMQVTTATCLRGGVGSPPLSKRSA
jgi:hypothetical protein